MPDVIKKRNKKTVIVLSIVTVLSFVCCISLIRVAVEKTETPEFCATCHSMQSSYNTWKETVACNTGCLDCHTHDNSGKTLAVEIVDNNCTKSGCHLTEKLASDASKYKETFSFKHETHLKEFAANLKIKCIGCHAYPGKEGQGGDGIKHFDVDENACFVCHFVKSDTPLPRKIRKAQDFRPAMNGKIKNKIEKSLALQGKDIRGLLAASDKNKDGNDVDDCSLCHIDVQANVMIYENEFVHLKYEKELDVECTNCHFETVHNNGGIDKNSCYYCHTNVPGDYTDTNIMHDDHVKKHKVPCSPCHSEIQHKWGGEYVRFVLPERSPDAQKKYLMRISNLDQNPEPDNISINSKDEENLFGDNTYPLQRNVYRGINDKWAEGSPDPMHLATVNCTACHKEKDLSVDPEVCNICHVKGFDKMMLEQKEYTKRMLNVLSVLIKDSQTQGIPKGLIKEAKRNYKLVVDDGSYGVHNIKYVKDLIDYSMARLNSIENKNILKPGQRLIIPE